MLCMYMYIHAHCNTVHIYYAQTVQMGMTHHTYVYAVHMYIILSVCIVCISTIHLANICVPYSTDAVMVRDICGGVLVGGKHVGHSG